MPPTSPAPGATYTYTGAQLGERADTALHTGTEVTVREVVPADFVGAHNTAEDSVVIEWEVEGQIITETRFETRATPVMATAEDGSVIVDAENQPVFRLQSNEVPVHTYGRGPIPRAMSISVEQFAADFTEA